MSTRDVAKMCQEGGVNLINFLLSKAIDNEIVPNPSSVCEWTYRDILKMPLEQQKEWKTACLEELEALRQ